MNKIYKLVWSKTRNMYIAVCEFAKSHTKSPKSNVISRTVGAGVLACVLSCGAVMPVMAADKDTVTSSAANTTKLFLLGHTAAGTAAAKYDSNIYATTTAGQLYVGSLQSGGAISGTALSLSSATPQITVKNTGITRGTAPTSANSKWLIESLDSTGKVTGGLYKTVGTDNVSATYLYNYSNYDDTAGGKYVGIRNKNLVLDDASTLNISSLTANVNEVEISGTVYRDYGLAIGANSKVFTQGSAAYGVNAIVFGDQSVAIGPDSIANDDYTVSFGHKIGDAVAYNWDNENNTYTQTWETNVYRRLVNVADGTDDHDVSTVGQMHTYTTPADNGNYVTGFSAS